MKDRLDWEQQGKRARWGGGWRTKNFCESSVEAKPTQNLLGPKAHYANPFLPLSPTGRENKRKPKFERLPFFQHQRGGQQSCSQGTRSSGLAKLQPPSPQRPQAPGSLGGGVCTGGVRPPTETPGPLPGAPPLKAEGPSIFSRS